MNFLFASYRPVTNVQASLRMYEDPPEPSTIPYTKRGASEESDLKYSCVYQESFVREGQTLTMFFFSVDEGKEDQNGPSSSRQLNII